MDWFLIFGCNCTPFANDSSVHWFTDRGVSHFFAILAINTQPWTAINMDPSWESIWESAFVAYFFFFYHQKLFLSKRPLLVLKIVWSSIVLLYNLDFHRPINIDICCQYLHEFSISPVQRKLTMGRHLKCADYVDRWACSTSREAFSMKNSFLGQYPGWWRGWSGHCTKDIA